MKEFKNIFFTKRFYGGLVFISLVLFAGFFIDLLFLVGKIFLLLFIVLFVTDFLSLFLKGKKLLLSRDVPERMSNGDENDINIDIKNNYPFEIKLALIDELPIQLQIRDFKIEIKLGAGAEKRVTYKIHPKSRGEYEFGKLNAFIHNYIGLIVRRFTVFNERNTSAVYPSFIQMKKFQLLAISDRLNEAGITKIRSIGHHSEFDQIREYVKGDDYRSVNWKATARKDKVMVNQYQDERSQQIYSIIDKGRVMRMPFDKMKLLDYAINSTLVISDTVIRKHDKAGLITFNTKIDTYIPADNKSYTIPRILESLYNQETEFDESNFELLYSMVMHKVSHRSLLILYTNFESRTSLKRYINILTNLSKFHVVLLVLFENTEIQSVTEKEAESLEDIYIKTAAESFTLEKKLISKELNAMGIYSILTRPQNLTVNLINKYLQFKHQGIF